MNNYGSELLTLCLYAATVGSIWLLKLLCRKIKNRRHFLVRAADALYSAFGPMYFLIVFEGSNMEIAGFSIINFYYVKGNKAQLAGVALSAVCMAGNLLVGFFGFKFLREYSEAYRSISEEHRTASSALHSCKEPATRKRLEEARLAALSRLEAAASGSRYCSMRFLIDGYRPGLRRLWLMTPVISIAKNVLSQLVVLLLSGRGMAQVYAIFALTTLHTAFVLWAPVKLDPVENLVHCATAVLFEAYLLMVVLVNREAVDEDTAQTRFGLVMAAILVLIVSVNLLFIGFTICKSLFRMIKYIFHNLRSKPEKKKVHDQSAKSIGGETGSQLFEHKQGASRTGFKKPIESQNALSSNSIGAVTANGTSLRRPKKPTSGPRKAIVPVRSAGLWPESEIASSQARPATGPVLNNETIQFSVQRPKNLVSKEKLPVRRLVPPLLLQKPAKKMNLNKKKQPEAASFS